MTERRSLSRTLFWRYWTASTVSDAGSEMAAVALPLLAVIALDASVLQVALLAAAGRVPWILLGLPAGVIVQRYPLRAMQVAMDLVRVVAIGSIPVAWWLGGLSFEQLMVATFLSGCATVLFGVGNQTYLPSIIGREELQRRNSTVSGTQAVTQTGGSSLGGLLVQVVGPYLVLVLDTLSYLVSALVLVTMPERRAGERLVGGMLASIRDGFRYVTHHPVMGPCMFWATTVNFVNGALVALTPVYLIRIVDLSPALVGIIIALDGVGSIVGAMFATRLAEALGTARVMIVTSTAGGLLLLTAPLATSPATVALFGLGLAGFAFGVVIGSITARTHRQTTSSPEMLSRVFATVRFVSWGAIPLGSVAAGTAATLLGIRPTLWIVCALSLVAPMLLLMSRVGRLRDLSDGDPVAVRSLAD